MQQRKLIKLGNSSFAIALPIDWIKKSGLKKGEDVFLEENSNGEMIVSSRFKKLNGDKEINIEIDGKEDLDIKRKFTSAYIRGNSIFNFTGNTLKERNKIIKELIKSYLSCEVVEETEKNLKVKDFFNFEEVNMGSFIKRIDNNLREMFSIMVELLNKEKISKKEMDDLEKIDADINKFYFLNSRIMILGMNNPSLISKLKMVPIELFNNWWLSFHLEHAGDSVKSISRQIKCAELNNDHKKTLIPLLNRMKLKYENSLKSFYNKDVAKAHEVMEEGIEIDRFCEQLVKGKDSFLSVVGEKLKEINNSSYQIAKMVANMEK